jgi:hypothetical protein
MLLFCREFGASAQQIQTTWQEFFLPLLHHSPAPSLHQSSRRLSSLARNPIRFCSPARCISPAKRSPICAAKAAPSKNVRSDVRSRGHAGLRCSVAPCPARRGPAVWVAHPSRVLAMVSRHRELFLYHATNPKFRLKKSLFRRDAETNTRDACATQKSSLEPWKQRHRLADDMFARQSSPLRIRERKALFLSAQLHLPIQLIENSVSSSWQYGRN